MVKFSVYECLKNKVLELKWQKINGKKRYIQVHLLQTKTNPVRIFFLEDFSLYLYFCKTLNTFHHNLDE